MPYTQSSQTQDSSWFFLPFNIINGVYTTFSSLYQHASTVFHSTPEYSFYFESSRNPTVRQYQLWCALFKESVKNQIQAIETSPHSIDPKAFRDFLLQWQSFDQNFSPIYYEHYLKKTKEKIKHLPKYAHALQKSRTQLRKKLQNQPTTALQFFYDDLINHLIEFSGSLFSPKDFQKVMIYYQQLVPEPLYQNIDYTIQRFLHQHNKAFEESKTLLQPPISNKDYKALIDDINAAFSVDSFVQNDEETQPLTTIAEQRSWSQQLTEMGSKFVHQIKQHPYATLLGFLGITSGIYSLANNQHCSFNGNTVNVHLSSDWSNAIGKFGGQFVSVVALSYWGNQAQLSYGMQDLPLAMGLATTWLSTVDAQTTSILPISDELFLKTSTKNISDWLATIYYTIDGGNIATGSTKNYGAGARDIFVIKRFENGTIDWAVTWGGWGDEEGSDIIQSRDGGYVLGGHVRGEFSSPSSTYDVCVMKLYANGTVDWVRTLGGSDNDNAYSIFENNQDGSIIVSGASASPFQLGTSRGKAFLAKFSANGVHLGSHLFYPSNFNDQISASRGTSDNNLIMVGNTGDNPTNAFIMKLRLSDNTIMWARSFGGPNGDSAATVVEDSDGNYLFAGETVSFGVGGSYDAFVAKFDVDGSFVWANTLGGFYYEATRGRRGIIKTNENNFVMTGFTDSIGPSPGNIWLGWIAKFDDNATLQWLQGFGNGFDGGGLIAITNDPDLIFGSNKYLGGSDYSFSVAKLDVNGTFSGCSYFFPISLVDPPAPGALTWRPITSPIVAPISLTNFVDITSGLTVQNWDNVPTQPINFKEDLLCPIMTTAEFTTEELTTAELGTGGISTMGNDVKPPETASSPDTISIGLLAGILAGGGTALFALCAVTILLVWKHKKPPAPIIPLVPFPDPHPPLDRNLPRRFIGGRYILMTYLSAKEADYFSQDTGIAVEFSPPELEKGKLLIGEGYFGRCGIVYDINDRQFIAIKKIKNTTENPHAIENSRTEAALQKALQHSHIMPLLDSLDTTGKNEQPVLCQFMPLASFGNGDDLKKCLDQMPSEKAARKERYLTYVAKSLLEAFAYMHSQHIAHLDVKPDNFVLNHKGWVWITDFGCAKQLASSEGRFTEDSLGDRRYFSPDRMAFEGDNATHFDAYKADIWALGLTLLALLVNRAYSHPQDLLRSPELQNPKTGSLFALIKQLLTENSDQRPTAQAALDQNQTLFNQKEGQWDEESVASLFQELGAKAPVISVKSETAMTEKRKKPAPLPKHLQSHYKPSNVNRYGFTPGSVSAEDPMAPGARIYMNEEESPRITPFGQHAFVTQLGGGSRPPPEATNDPKVQQQDFSH